MRFIVLLLSCLVALPLTAAEVEKSTVKSDTALISTRHTNATPLVEGPNDASIVKFVAQILQRQHYLRREIDDEVSSKFLDRYLDSLDNLFPPVG
jgi:hypothetical protein